MAAIDNNADSLEDRIAADTNAIVPATRRVSWFKRETMGMWVARAELIRDTLVLKDVGAAQRLETGAYRRAPDTAHSFDCAAELACAAGMPRTTVSMAAAILATLLALTPAMLARLVGST